MNTLSKHATLLKTLLVLGVLAMSTLFGRLIAWNSAGGQLEGQPPNVQAMQAQLPVLVQTSGESNQARWQVATQPNPMDLSQQSSKFQASAPANGNQNNGRYPEDGRPNVVIGTPPAQNNGYVAPQARRIETPEGRSSPGYRVEVHPIVKRVPNPNRPGEFLETVTYRSITVRDDANHSQDQQSSGEIQHLLQELRAQKPDSRDQLKLAELREKVKKQFETRHAEQANRLEKVLADAQQAQEILDRRHEQRVEIIDRRVAELLGQADPMSWDYPLPADVEVNGNLSWGVVPGVAPGNPSLAQSIVSQLGPGRLVPEGITISPATPTPPEPPVSPTFPPVGLPLRTRPISPAQPRSPEKPEVNSTVELQMEVLENATGINRFPATDPLGKASSADSSGLVATGYRWKGAEELLRSAETNFLKGSISPSELLQLKNNLETIQAQWQQQLRALERELQLKELALEDAKLEEKLAESNVVFENDRRHQLARTGATDYGNLDNLVAKHQQARNAVRRAELELEAIVEDLKWANDFQKQLEVNTEGTTKDDEPQLSEPPAAPLPASIAPAAPEATPSVEVPPKPADSVSNETKELDDDAPQPSGSEARRY